MSLNPPSGLPDFENRDRTKRTVLYVPVEGEIKVIPYTSTTKLSELLESEHYEGLAFGDMKLAEKGYRLAGFIRTNYGRGGGPINKRCSKIHIAEIPGPVVIMNEDSKGYVPLTEADIPFIFYQEQNLQ
ncbi:hypothetical protein EMPS_06913 [Entomortierella parvispora]|uniref:Uncharacterized protein n=1 Tax=Entomortierella parvispora TaxID=205924 RepID=A0A9P3HDJ0_9FUNG|nr:hypothetical protein EMPS_06913 [Entomortierella parvispora]